MGVRGDKVMSVISFCHDLRLCPPFFQYAIHCILSVSMNP
nr:MAG TPA: hypothetical protein [Caudoviricetes sp.]